MVSPMITLGSYPTPPVSRGTVWLPLVANVSTPSPVAQFCRLLTGDQRQERPHLELCPALQQAAIWRAYGLAHGEPWAHVDSHGVTSNEYARRAGCLLPDDYSAKGNNVESLAAGSPDALVMFTALANSPSHSDHIFGRGWFQRQNAFGVAMCEGGEYGFYWCVLLAQCLGQTSGE